MKKNITSLLILGISCVASMFGQIESRKEIRPMEAVSDDYHYLLKSCGYQAFPFDISSLSDGQYALTIKIKEYKEGKKVHDDIYSGALTFPNMLLLSEFRPEDQATIKPEEMTDPERGILSLARKLMIGLTPTVNDSIRPMVFNVENIMDGSVQLRMMPQYERNDSINGKKKYSYETRPFKVGEFSTDEFIPLVLFGSYWYDKDFGIHRFCGEKEIEPDMSSEILKYLPHYYIIGVEIKPINIFD